MSSNHLYTVARHVARRGLQVCTRLKFQTYKTDVKETWKLLNSVIKPKKSSVKINKLIIDDNIITDHQEVCNRFNEYFASVGSGIADCL